MIKIETNREYPVSSDFSKNAHINQEDYLKLYQQSINYPEQFWSEQAKKFITWSQPWSSVTTGNFVSGDVKWFIGGQLNACYNCVDRHLDTHKHKTAIIWEGNHPDDTKKITYSELHEQICKFSNVLKHYGVQKGDRVCLYLPMIPELIVAMLACARIGAIHTVVFAGFSPESLKSRILDAHCSLLITADEGLRGEKTIPLKKNCSLAINDCPNLKHVIVVKRTGNPIPWVPLKDHWYHDVMSKADTSCAIESMDSSAPLFILYTSGSTGKPKGVVHATGGYLVYTAITFNYVFDYKENDIYWCTADIGWITGHSYSVYGPLTNGATILLFEGTPQYPTYSRYWDIIDKHQVSIFYTAPTALRALRHEGDEWIKKTHRKSLKILGTVGEPINPDVWEWYYRTIGDSRCPIVDTWWQTETGGIMITALPGATPLRAGKAGWPFLGVLPEIVDTNGNPVQNGQTGRLVIKRPWPGLMQGIYGDKKRFINNYFHEIPGCYLTGDGAYRDNDGYFTITGRLDDVINVSGHRIGTEEIESALVMHPAVSEAAVVPIPHDITGEAIYAYVTTHKTIKNSNTLKKELTSHVRTIIGSIAIIETIQWAKDLPKTRSGKIMRRVLRKIACNEHENLGDLSTLAEPTVIEQLIAERETS